MRVFSTLLLAAGTAAAAPVEGAYTSPASLWLRGNPGQSCADMWGNATQPIEDPFAPSILLKLLGGASSLCAPNSFGQVAVDCGGSVGEHAGQEFIAPTGADAAAAADIVQTFGTQGYNLAFVLRVSTAGQVQTLVGGQTAFFTSVGKFLDTSGFNGLQIDLRDLPHDPSTSKPLTTMLLALAASLQAKAPLTSVSVVVAGAGSDVPVDLATLGAAVSAAGVAPVTVVTTSTFAPELDVFVRALNSTSDAFGSADASAAAYSPGISISDEVDEFKPKMYELWDKVNALKARQVSKLFVDMNILKPETDGQRTDAYLPLIGTLFSAPRDMSESLAPPASLADASTWLSEQKSWRNATVKQYHLENAAQAAAYTRDNTNRVSFSAPQVMLHDRFLFDRKAGKWTVSKFLADVTARYGGVDTVLLWHNYPNIGVDDQTQFDLFNSLPGSVAAMKEVVSEFHDAGVKVLLSYNPWDSGTRPAAQPMPDSKRVVDLIKAVGADGANGDTMNGMAEEWWAEAERIDYPVALQPELGFGELNWLGNITFNTLSWAYLPYAGSKTDDIPWEGVADLPIPSKYSFLVEAHHAQICERWARQHVNGLQHAFFMGRGFVPWENVWGVFNEVNEGDGEALRRIRPLLTFASSLNLTIGGAWSPFTTDVRGSDATADAIVSSRFDGIPGFSRNDRLWLTVNRRARGADVDADVAVFTDDASADDGACYYDLYLGNNITDRVVRDQGHATFNLTVDPMDYSAVLRTGCSGDEAAPGLESFLSSQAALVGGRSLSSFSFQSIPQPQQEFVVAPELPFGGVRSGQNDTTVSIPAFGTYTFATQGVQVEGWHGFPGVSESMQPDVQYPWEDRPTRLHEPRSLVEVLPKEETNGFEMDRHPVTNAQFLSFLQQSGWWPGNQTAAAAAPGASSLADGHSEQNFLNHWTTTASSSSSSKMGMAQLGTKRARTVGNPKKVPVAGTEQQPVRWVSMNDARRYCAFYGKRLPRDYEWQFAAQGGNASRTYPWGDDWDASRVPGVVTAKSMGEPVDVGMYPNGSSTFGVEELVGHIWQWTEEYCDFHTCRGIVRGGHWWRPMGSMWYFPQAYKLTQHNTILLLSDSMDRNGGTGFRCVADNS